MRTFVFLLILIIVGLIPLQAQTQTSWDDFVERMTEESTDEDAIDEETFNELYDIHTNPININTATEQQLRTLPFLTDSQCRDILHYVKLHGPMISLGELMGINTLSADTRSYLHLFCYAGPQEKPAPTLKDMFRHSDNELNLRTDIPFYQKAGYKDVPSDILSQSPNKVYRGNNLYHSLRYRFTAGNHIDAGIQLEKDPGERGIDYISAYAIVNNLGPVRTAAIGNYRISFGQGLAVNTGVSYGKLMVLNSLNRMDRGIHRHSSTSETGYFSGAAATIDISTNIHATAFFSSRKEDGTYLSDSTGISSLKTDGLHRTTLERSKKGNLTNTTFGGNLHLRIRNFDLSATAVHTHYSTPLAPKHNTPSSLYRLYNAHGSDFGAYSLAYSFLIPDFSFRGETATSSSGGMATINSAQWIVDQHHRLTAIHRYYGARYVAVNARSFGENSRPQNENGLFLGWTTTAISNTTLETYIDIVHFPWLKHQVSASSNSIDGTIQLTNKPSKRLTLSARYRFKTKQKDHKTGNDNQTTRLTYHTTHSLRLQCHADLTPSLASRTTISTTLKQLKGKTTAKGFLISENLKWKPSDRLKTELTFTYFNTDSYDSRISIYEPSLLYTFGFRTLYNHGIRTSFLASLPLGKLIGKDTSCLTLNAKLGSTVYFGQHTIGTGLELITQNHREDLQMQLRWKF